MISDPRFGQVVRPIRYPGTVKMLLAKSDRGFDALLLAKDMNSAGWRDHDLGEIASIDPDDDWELVEDG